MQHERIGERSVEVGAASDLGVAGEEIRQFWRRHWQRIVALTLPEFYDWQFLNAPSNLGKDTTRVATLGSRLVGVLGVTEHPFILDGKKLSCAELTTWIIDPDMKGHGIGLRMIRDVMAHYQALIGSGISDSALKIYMQSGVNYMRLMPRLFRIYNVDAVRPYAKITPFGEKLALIRAAAPRDSALKINSVPAADLGDLAEETLSGKNHALRDAAHLGWRYDQHPKYRYEAYRINDRCGIVLRRDTILGMNFAHVLDVFSPDNARMDVTAFIDEFARTNALAAVDFYCTSSEITASFLAAGWFSTIDDKMFQLANLFYPPEFLDTQTTSIICWADGKRERIGNYSKLYMTKGDVDMDRPPMRYLEEKGLVS